MLPSIPLTWWHSCQEEPSELYHQGSIQGFIHDSSNTWLAPITKTHIFPLKSTLKAEVLNNTAAREATKQWWAGAQYPRNQPPMPEWLLPCCTHTHHEVLGMYMHLTPQKTWTIFLIFNYSEQNMEMLQPCHCISNCFSVQCNIFPHIHLYYI